MRDAPVRLVPPPHDPATSGDPAAWPSQHVVLAALGASGLTTRRFASLTGRDERSVRRWLAGGTIPPEARDWLVRFLTLSPRVRAAVVRALSK